MRSNDLFSDKQIRCVKRSSLSLQSLKYNQLGFKFKFQSELGAIAEMQRLEGHVHSLLYFSVSILVGAF